jgi:hypothetical protein
MEYLEPAPQWSPRSGGRGRRVVRLDHPFDHPDDPTGPVWSRLDRRGIQREQARSVWSRPDRRRAPGYGSGGSGVRIPRGAHHRNVSSLGLLVLLVTPVAMSVRRLATAGGKHRQVISGLLYQRRCQLGEDMFPRSDRGWPRFSSSEQTVTWLLGRGGCHRSRSVRRRAGVPGRRRRRSGGGSRRRRCAGRRWAQRQGCSGGRPTP